MDWAWLPCLKLDKDIIRHKYGRRCNNISVCECQLAIDELIQYMPICFNFIARSLLVPLYRADGRQRVYKRYNKLHDDKRLIELCPFEGSVFLLFWKELLIQTIYLSICVFAFFHFGFEGRMLDLISVPSHCLFFTLLYLIKLFLVTA